MARIEMHAVASEPEWVQPSELVEAAVKQVEHAVAGHKLDVSTDGEKTLVRVDPRLISSALAHLLENAGQYSSPGTAISVNVACTPSEIRIAVRDRGTGIAPNDLLILDLGLPDMDGSEICRRVRERSETPILVLSARDAEKDKVAALDHGADDYVTKPFGLEELMARVRAALRRSLGREGALHGQLRRGDLTIDFDRHRVHRGDAEIRLTPKEFELLTLLVTHAGRVLTHRAILKSIWGANGLHQPEHLRVLMGQLRKKVEPEPSNPRYLLTEPWVGYRFADESQDAAQP